MKTPRGLRKAIRRAAAEPPGQSPLYRYMKANHAALAATAGDDGRMNWLVLCPELARLGITDRDGKPPSPGRAAKTWLRVCADVTRRAAAKAARPPAKRPPSRLPDSLRPLEAPRPAAPPPPPAPQQGQAHPPAPAAGMAAPSPPSGGAPGARSPPEAYDPETLTPAEQEEILKRKLAGVDAVTAFRDRFLHPVKRN